jgi:hypothetical protein
MNARKRSTGCASGFTVNITTIALFQAPARVKLYCPRAEGTPLSKHLL